MVTLIHVTAPRYQRDVEILIHRQRVSVLERYIYGDHYKNNFNRCSKRFVALFESCTDAFVLYKGHRNRFCLLGKSSFCVFIEHHKTEVNT